MQREECIYNLIPKIVIQPKKPERYRSQHDPMVKPTASTFGCHGKTRILGSNVGECTRLDKPSSARGFGRLDPKPDPKEFTKRGEKCKFELDKTKKPAKFNYPGGTRPPIVKRDEKPIMGLKSSKNFVTVNAVESILAVPGNRARVKEEPPRYVEKEDYGQVPKYLDQVKDEIQRENELIDEFVRQNRNIQQDEEHGRLASMDEDERLQLVDALKAKWDHVNGKYQKLCHNVVFDTLGKVRRKETFERELDQLEKDIALLQKGPVAVAPSLNY